jgi:outer membrane protein assembly factor BamB
MRISYLLAAVLAIPGILLAQRQADWSVEVSGVPQQILFQPLTGIPILQTDKAYVGVDPEQKKAIWTIQRSAVKALSAVVDSEIDYFNVHETPYVIIRNSLIDSRDGKLIIDKEKEDFTSIESFELVPQLGAVLLRIQGKGMLQLYLVDLKTNQISWKTEVVKSSGIELTSSNAPEVTDIGVAPGTTLITKGKQIIYVHKKNLACIDGTSGKLLWVEKSEPGLVLTTPDEKTVLSVEAGGGGLMSAMSAAFSGITLGSKIKAFDVLSGKEVWKKELEAKENIRWIDPRPEYLVVTHKDGCNLYNYASAEPLWKKDFDGKRVYDVQANSEGFLVLFNSGYRSMQLDKNGKELWKKPQSVLDTEDEIEIPEEGGVDRYAYDKGTVIVTPTSIVFYPKKGSGIKKWSESLDASVRMAYDASRKNIILAKGKYLWIVNPDQNPKVNKELKIDLEAPSAFNYLEIRDQSYFMSSSQEYAILNFATDGIVNKYYKRPADSKAFLAGLASTALYMGAGALALSSGVNAMKGATSAMGMTSPGLGSTSQNMDNAMLQSRTGGSIYDIADIIPKGRIDAFKQTQGFAYFLATEKQDKDNVIFLAKVNKDSGVEADKLIFDDARPVYQVDEITKRVYYLSKGMLKVFNM